MRLVAVLLAVVCLLALGTPTVAARAPSSLDPVACPVPVPAGASVTCGWLVVPESRDRPDGRRIRLMVAVVRSPTLARPPLLVTAGGPGSSSMGLLGLAGSAYAQDRDLVVLEQRGTRESEPALDCPEVEEALQGTLRSPRSPRPTTGWPGTAPTSPAVPTGTPTWRRRCRPRRRGSTPTRWR